MCSATATGKLQNFAPATNNYEAHVPDIICDFANSSRKTKRAPTNHDGIVCIVFLRIFLLDSSLICFWNGICRHDQRSEDLAPRQGNEHPSNVNCSRTTGLTPGSLEPL